MYVEMVNAGGVGTTFKSSATWSTSWTALSPYTLNGDGYVLLYKVATGDAKVLKLNPGGTGTTTMSSSVWTLGWS
jgi:hypothetical protein